MKGYYALAAVSVIAIGVGVWLMLDHNKQKQQITSAIMNFDNAVADGIITREEAPGLASLIDSGRIHEADYRYNPNRSSGATT